MQFRYVVQLASCTTGEMKIDFKGDYPHSHAWVERLTARPVVKVLERLPLFRYPSCYH